jgi:hypothetical protein
MIGLIRRSVQHRVSVREFLSNENQPRYCLTTAQLDDFGGWSVFSIFLAIFLCLDFIALLLVVLFVWMESFEKQVSEFSVFLLIIHYLSISSKCF